MSTSTGWVTYRSSPPRFVCLVGCGMLLIGVPLVWAAVARGGQAGAAAAIGLVMGPPGTLLLLLGLAYRKLRVDLAADHAVFTLPRAGSNPWFPWKVSRTKTPWPEVCGVDIRDRSNAYAPDGIERLVFVRTQDGDFYLNSLWFPGFDDLVVTILDRSGVPLTEADLDQPAPVAADGSPPPLAAREWLARGAGWTLLGGSLLLAAGGLLVAVFGDPAQRGTAVRSLMLLAIGVPAAGMLLRYRRPYHPASFAGIKRATPPEPDTPAAATASCDSPHLEANTSPGRDTGS